MSIYDDMQQVTRELLDPNELGQPGIQYIHITPGNGPKDAPGAPTETLHNLSAAGRPVQFRFVDGKTIIQTDSQVTMADKPGLVPDDKGFVKTPEGRYKVIAVKRIPLTGPAVAWVLIFRK